MEQIKSIQANCTSIQFLWSSSIDDRDSYFLGIENVVSECEDDFVPYTGFGSEDEIKHSFFENYQDKNEDMIIVVTEDENQVVGFLCFEPNSSRSDVPVDLSSFGYLSLVMVTPEFRGYGIGKELCRCGIELLREEYSQDHIFLSTWEKNTRQMSILRSLGFKQVARKVGHRVDGTNTVYLGLC